jgi:drug/metabolite transporter (DMT)-like permease|tara:strand:+ start:1401 stop:2303 length:903 start_codon:yes stop_codon:yes gene_type:complete
MDKRTLAIFAALGATFIYALNHTIAKDVMPTYVQGFGFIGIRLIGATIVFWLLGLLIPKQPIDKADRWAFLRAAFFGMAINMLAFFKGLEYSTPINSTVIITTTPIMVFLFSVILLKENIRPKRAIGVLIGFLGALSLVLFSQQAPANAPNISLGNFLFIVNASAYGLYMIYVKPLSEKYNTIHLLKWLFLIGLVITMPFTLPELLAVDFQQMPLSIWWRIGFVVLGTTFMTYLLMVYAIRHLRATSLSVFTYLQPIIGIVYAVLVGADFITPIKWITMSLVLVGVYLVTKQEQPKDVNL